MILKSYIWVVLLSYAFCTITIIAKGLKTSLLEFFIFWLLLFLFYLIIKFFKRILLKIEIIDAEFILLTFSKYFRIHKYKFYLGSFKMEFIRTMRARGIYGDTVLLTSKDYICKIEVPQDGWEKSTFLEINEMCKDAQV